MAPNNSEGRGRDTETEAEIHDLASARQEIRKLTRIINELSEAMHGNGAGDKFETSVQYRLGQLADEQKRQGKAIAAGLKWVYGVAGTVVIMAIRAIWTAVLESKNGK